MGLTDRPQRWLFTHASVGGNLVSTRRSARRRCERYRLDRLANDGERADDRRPTVPARSTSAGNRLG
jgi:hypothetical protein